MSTKFLAHSGRICLNSGLVDGNWVWILCTLTLTVETLRMMFIIRVIIIN